MFQERHVDQVSHTKRLSHFGLEMGSYGLQDTFHSEQSLLGSTDLSTLLQESLHNTFMLLGCLIGRSTIATSIQSCDLDYVHGGQLLPLFKDQVTCPTYFIYDDGICLLCQALSQNVRDIKCIFDFYWCLFLQFVLVQIPHHIWDLALVVRA